MGILLRTPRIIKSSISLRTLSRSSRAAPARLGASSTSLDTAIQRGVNIQRSFSTARQFRMSEIKGQHGHSAACCSIPPIVAKDYKEKGKYETIGGLKTYVTGSSNASKGLLYIYDIFGYFPQSIQGADILATSDKDNQYQVFIPDWFEGKPADISWYPPDNDEKGKALGNFFQTTGAPPATASKVPTIVEALTKAYPSPPPPHLPHSKQPPNATQQWSIPPKPKASRSLFACWPVMMNSRRMSRSSRRT